MLSFSYLLSTFFTSHYRPHPVLLKSCGWPFHLDLSSPRIKHVKGQPSFSPPFEASTVFRQVLDISCYFSCSFLQLKPAKAFHSTHSHKEHAIEEDNISCKAHLIFYYFAQKSVLSIMCSLRLYTHHGMHKE